MEKLTVSKVNLYIKSVLENNFDLKNLYIEGEISKIKYYPKHCYYTIKDKSSSIDCVTFNYHFIPSFPLDLKEGDAIELKADVNFYDKDAKLQLLVKSLVKQNKIGEKLLELEKLKLYYKELGYFDESRKRKIPYHISKIGIVTAKTGAALQDMIKTKINRNNNVDIYLYNSLVQGDMASKQIAKGIEELNKIDEIEVIIVGRGGGSIEDLWCFNEKEVVEAIYNSKKPVISAVGHEIDFLLSDYVADIRASTPTQAIEKIVLKKEDEIEKLKNIKLKLDVIIKNILENYGERLENIKNNYHIRNINNILLSKGQEIDNLKEKIKYIINRIGIENKNLLNNYSIKLKSLVENKLYNEKNKLEKIKIDLKKYSIKDMLNNGYTINIDNKGNIIKSVENIKNRQIIKSIYNDGEIISTVKEIKKEIK